VGVEHRLLAWPLGTEGRKSMSGAAIVDPDDTVVAVCESLWITLPTR
jgi:hypothetical protein